ncbi:MAG TPA: hypothetical protein VKT51_05415 [Candidatus Eremiobacteraceae bacterium]|nr:hypothetical protein [Candidatus Eremiobacteraceae bacterium]
MKRTLSIAIFAAILFGMLYVGPIPAARADEGAGCSLAGVAGAYGFTYTGLAVLPSSTVPVSSVGSFRTDAAGNFIGSESNNTGGNSVAETIQGTITVKHDCSGALVAKVYSGGMLVRTSYIHLQYENNATEVLGIFEKVVLPDNSILPVVITIDGKRIDREGR